MAIIGKSLGHKDLKSTQVYARLQLDPVKDAVSRATGAIIDAGLSLEVLTKSGTWISFEDKKLGQGRDAADALGDALFADDLEQSLLGRVGQVRSAAKRLARDSS